MDPDWEKTCGSYDEICEKLGLYWAFVFNHFGEEDVRRIIETFLEEVKRSTMRPPWGVDIPGFGKFWANEGLGVEFEEAPKAWGKYIVLPEDKGEKE